MSGSKKKVVVLDDEQNIGRLLELILEVNNFAVNWTTTVDKALKLVDSKKPDLIISDIMLQEKCGFDLYWELQKSPKTSSIPFIFISAYPEESVAGREKIEKQRGAKVVFLAKLFSPQTLLHAIKKVLGN